MSVGRDAPRPSRSSCRANSAPPTEGAALLCETGQLPELTVFACDDTTPGIAAVVVAVVAVLAAVAEVVAVVAVVAVDAFGVACFDCAPVAAMQPVSVNIATTLPVPTSRRERRAGWGLGRRRRVGVVFGGLERVMDP